MPSDDADPYATIASGGGLILGGRVVKIALLFGVQILMARVLGATSYGGVVLAMMLVSVGGLFGNLGMPRGLTRNVPRYEDEPERARGVLRAGLLLSLLASLVTAMIVFVAAPFLATRVFDDPALTTLFRIAAAAIPLSVLTGIGVSIARAARTAKPQVIVNHFLDPVARAVFIGGLVLAGFGAAGAVGGAVLTYAVAAVAAGVLAYFALPFDPRGPATPMYRQMLAFSLPLMMAASVDFLISNTDTFLVGAFLASASVGIYNVAFQLRTAGLFFFHPLTYLLPPVLTRLDTTDRREEAQRTYQLISKWAVLATIPLFLGVFFFPEVAIRMSFGGQYEDGALALRILVVPVLVTVLLGANEKALIALGHNRISFYVNAAVAAVNIVLNVLLIPRYGITGAAVASAVAFVGRDVAFSTALYRWDGLHPFSRPMLKPTVAVLLFSLPGYLAFVTFVPVTVPTVVAAGLVFLALYAPAVVLLGGLEPDDGRLLSMFETRYGVEFRRLRSAVSRLQP